METVVTVVTVECGDKVRDKISKVSGIVTSITTYLDDDISYGIQSEGGSNGVPNAAFSLFKNRVELVEKGVWR